MKDYGSRRMEQNQNESDKSYDIETVSAVASISDDRVEGGACEKTGVMLKLVADLVEELVFHETLEDIVKIKWKVQLLKCLQFKYTDG